MACTTGTEIIFDIGSLYEQFEKLSDRRSAKGPRYSLAVILVLIIMAKMSGIAEWAKYRGEEMAGMLNLPASQSRIHPHQPRKTSNQ